jgi:hypothetical protein
MKQRGPSAANNEFGNYDVEGCLQNIFTGQSIKKGVGIVLSSNLLIDWGLLVSG